MSFLDTVHAKREKLAAVLRDEDYSGIRAIVEELYPDRAHFLYELLQNAEDAEAEEVWFDLRADMLIFEHTGRPFSEQNVWGITNIGKGTKRDREDQIGRFGVGFKAVFAYCETPYIWSPTFCFKITDLVLPTALAARSDLGGKSRFEFPFNNADKSPDDAYREVEEGLLGLAESTLLFLPHLKTIRWRIGGKVTGTVVCTERSPHHVEVLKHNDGKVTGNAHFLRFDQPVPGLEKQRVAVAWSLDFLPNVESFDPAKPIAKQLRIVPANPGRVAVYFPAEKETSGLRFHLHAPLVPELSRASVKETPANAPLFEQLAEVAAAALVEIRDLQLLSSDFLGTLPNPQDPVPERYQGIRTAIVEAMSTRPLTPTYSKSHAPATALLQGPAALKSLLSDGDIELLVDYEEQPPQWAVSPTQRNSHVDRFLESLPISEWGVEQFARLLRSKTGDEHVSGADENVTPEEVTRWLAQKPVEWHQELYALLQAEYLSKRRWDSAHFKTLRIVRLIDGTYGTASGSYFVGDGDDRDEVLQRVDPQVYSSGKSKVQKENARDFLEAIGVREVGEAELVEAILRQRYTKEAELPSVKTYKKDLKRFVELVENEPGKASLFKKFYVFLGTDDASRCTPESIYLDQPFLDTGLSAFYAFLGKGAEREALSDSYCSCGVSVARLAKFAQAVGAQTLLETAEGGCHSNPEYKYLYAVGGERYTSPINRDFAIRGLDRALVTPSLAISKLVWRSMSSLPTEALRAVFRKNESGGCRSAPSQLVHTLRRCAWVPQAKDKFVRPAEANRDALPGGFPFDPDWEWIEAIEFGKELAEQSQEQQRRGTLARQLGFSDEESLDRATRFAALPIEEQQRILTQLETSIDLPEHEPSNPERRAARVAALAASAPERTTEERTRSSSVSRDAVKQETGQYLRQQYTNADGQMICQACKARLPFQLDDGTDYFERVEMLPGLKRYYKQNYLALCPNHAAMFMHANGSAEELLGLVKELTGNTLSVVLAQEETTLYFTKTHLADLKVVIRTDEEGAHETDP